MKRIAVVGSPGAGKSTLSRMLAKKHRLPIYHLDFYFHQKTKDYYNPANSEKWNNQIREFIRKNEWIIDGNFRATFKERVERADAVYFIDVPRRVCYWRIFKRLIKYQFTPRTDMPKGWKEKPNWELIRLIWKYPKKTRPTLLKLSELPKSKVIILKNTRDIKRILNK